MKCINYGFQLYLVVIIFLIRLISKDGSTTIFKVEYHKYEVINNTIYEFDNEQEHCTFLRKHKLLKLTEHESR